MASSAQLAPNGPAGLHSPRHSDAGTVEPRPATDPSGGHQPVDDLLDAVERLIPVRGSPMGARFVIQAWLTLLSPPPPRNRPSVWRPSRCDAGLLDRHLV